MRFFFSPFKYIQKGFDVFNALDLMENKTFLEKLKFGIGDGNLQYYLYNWKCPCMGSEKVFTPRRALFSKDNTVNSGLSQRHKMLQNLLKLLSHESLSS